MNGSAPLSAKDLARAVALARELLADEALAANVVLAGWIAE
jgi:hypothetical protein